MEIQNERPQAEMKIVRWILRVGVAGTFLGHGLYAWSVRPSWLIYLQTVGFTPETAVAIMPIIGIVDVLVACLVLFWPMRVVFLWATLWAFAAATIRPIAGEPILEFIERASLWAAPLAYVFLVGFPKSLSDLFKR